MNLRHFSVIEEGLLKDLRPSGSNYSRVKGPTRPFKARILGYKNNGTMFIIRASIKRGGVGSRGLVRGRRPGKEANQKTRKISRGRILAQRVSRKYVNMNLLNYYYLCENGKRTWYEFIFYDPVRVKLVKKDRPLPRNRGWIFR